MDGVALDANDFCEKTAGSLRPGGIELEYVMEGDYMALSFAKDIRPLFRDGDIECMKPDGVALDDPAWMCVPANAQSVYGAVSGGSMPPDEPWPADRVSLFKEWMDAGCPA
jgi:hypothetical protein